MNWINVNESLPKLENDRKLSVDVLCYLNDGEMTVTYFNYLDRKWILNDFNVVTHWMYLPELPD